MRELHSVHADIVEASMAAGYTRVASERIAQVVTAVEATIALIEPRRTNLGVRLTDEHHIALYDSVSGCAFGPVFDDPYEADEFLDWLAPHGDPRDIHEDKLNGLYQEWKATA